MEEAQKKADILAVELIDDLEALETPESLMLNTVTSADHKDRTDREVVTPWLKFLWETYRTLLDVLKNNSRLEELYKSVAIQAFEFCLKYNRKSEMRRLCEILRQHLTYIGRQSNQMNAVDLDAPETMKMHLDLRFMQINCAVKLELWQEAYRSAEDIQALMRMTRKSPDPKMMLNFYDKLIQIFMVSDDLLFHAAGWNKYYSTALKNSLLSKEESDKAASLVLLSALASPVFAESVSAKDSFFAADERSARFNRLTALFGLHDTPSRSSLLRDAINLGLLQKVSPEIRDLYECLEVKFHPLLIVERVQPVMAKLIENPESSNYVKPLYRVIMARLLQQVSQVYSALKIEKLLKLASIPEPYSLSRFEIEKIILNGCKRGELVACIDHQKGIVKFHSDYTEAYKALKFEGAQLQRNPEEKMYTQLADLVDKIKAARSQLPDFPETDNQRKLFALLRKKMVEERREILKRKNYIEKKKEFMDNMIAEEERKEAEERQRKAQLEAEMEKQRLQEERKRRELERIQKEREEIERKQAEKLAEELRKKNLNIDVEQVEKLDKDKLLRMQVEQLEAEKKEKEAKLTALAKAIDHTERAYRKEEKPLIISASKEKKELDKKHHEESFAMLLEAKKRQFENDIKIKEKVKHLEKFIKDYTDEKSSSYLQSLAERKKYAAEMIAKEKAELIAEFKAKKRAEIKSKMEEEKRRIEEEEERRRLAEEKERKAEERLQQLRKEKEEREKQMREAQAQARLQMQREEEAEQNRLRRQKERESAEQEAAKETPWKRVEEKKFKVRVPSGVAARRTAGSDPTKKESEDRGNGLSNGSSKPKPGKYIPPALKK